MFILYTEGEKWLIENNFNTTLVDVYLPLLSHSYFSL